MRDKQYRKLELMVHHLMIKLSRQEDYSSIIQYFTLIKDYLDSIKEFKVGDEVYYNYSNTNDPTNVYVVVNIFYKDNETYYVIRNKYGNFAVTKAKYLVLKGV